MREKISTASKEAMKSKDALRVSTLRMVSAAIKDKDIEARGHGKGPISDDDVLALMQKMIKQRAESADMYAKAGRLELAEKENAEIHILNSFLPKQMDESDMSKAVQAAIVEVAAISMKDMGKVMAVLKTRYAGQMDFGKANGVIKSLLGPA